MNTRNNLIIFCQAPADVPYVLNIIQKHKEEIRNIFLYVINVEGIFSFFKSLHINVIRLEFIPYRLFDIKKIPAVYREKRRIQKIWKEHFAELSQIGCDVYFFSKFEDWLTSAFIVRFTENKNNKIFYHNHYDLSESLFKRRKKQKLRQLTINLMLKYLTSADFKTEIKEKIPELRTENYPILEVKAELNVMVFRDYTVNIFQKAKIRPRLLLFVSPCENTIFNDIRYDTKLLQIINVFHSLGYEIAAKGHPRMGMPPKIKEIIDHEIPSYIPGEFINPQEFNLCLGVYSAVICHFARHTDLQTYSLIELFEPSNIDFYKRAKNYLKLQSHSKLNFIKSEIDLDLIAKANTRKNDE